MGAKEKTSEVPVQLDASPPSSTYNVDSASPSEDDSQGMMSSGSDYCSGDATPTDPDNLPPATRTALRQLGTRMIGPHDGGEISEGRTCVDPCDKSKASVRTTGYTGTHQRAAGSLRLDRQARDVAEIGGNARMPHPDAEPEPTPYATACTILRNIPLYGERLRLSNMSACRRSLHLR